MKDLTKLIDTDPVTGKKLTFRIDVKRNPMSVMSKAENRMKMEIMAAEDDAIFKALDKVAIGEIEATMKL